APGRRSPRRRPLCGPRPRRACHGGRRGPVGARGVAAAGVARRGGRALPAAGARAHRRSGACAAGGVRAMTLLQSIDYAAIAPILAAGSGVVAVLVADVALPLRRRSAVLWVGVAAAAGC